MLRAAHHIELGLGVPEIDDLLAIFSPKVRHQIQVYLHADAYLEIAHGFLDSASEVLNKPLNIDIDGGQIDQEFFDALEELDAFIRANFKIEEVHAAQIWRKYQA